MFAERLKELRTKRHISQVKLAMDLGMNQNSISRYENLERQADYSTLIKFADYFDVSIDYLLERTDNPKAVRAVGSAMRTNPIIIVIPCHRVLQAGGGLGNYSAGGPANKEWLLTFEKQNK